MSETRETRAPRGYPPLRSRAALLPAQMTIQALLAIRETAGRPLLDPWALKTLAAECRLVAQDVPAGRETLRRLLLAAECSLLFRSIARTEIMARRVEGQADIPELLVLIVTEGTQTQLVLTQAIAAARTWARESFKPEVRR